MTDKGYNVTTISVDDATYANLTGFDVVAITGHYPQPGSMLSDSLMANNTSVLLLYRAGQSVPGALRF